MEPASSEVAVRPAPDAEINRLWLAGDPEALALAHVRYRARLESVAYRIVRDRADAEDVVQRVFLAVQRVAGKGTASLWTYLYRSAINGALSVLRTRNRRAALEAEGLRQALATEGASHDGVDQQVLEGQMLAAVAHALHEVRPRYRRVLALRIIWNLSNTEIAQREGVPLATVNTRLRRGREELRRHLQPLLRELGRNEP